MNSRFTVPFLWGVAGGLSAFVMLFFAFHLCTKSSCGISEGGQAVQSPEREPSPQGAWEFVTVNVGPGTVSVQSFYGTTLARYGSGIVVSADGLIVTTADVAAPGATLYQVFIGDKISRAQLVRRDTRSNLALLKVSDTGLSLAPVVHDFRFSNGQEVRVVGKRVRLSVGVLFVQRALVSAVDGGAPLLDLVLQDFLSGASVVTSHGDVVGIIQLHANAAEVISSADLEKFIQQYLHASPRPSVTP